MAAEKLVGHFFDGLASLHYTVEQVKLRANASFNTRSDLGILN